MESFTLYWPVAFLVITFGMWVTIGATAYVMGKRLGAMAAAMTAMSRQIAKRPCQLPGYRDPDAELPTTGAPLVLPRGAAQ